jgi:hypothetical protein
MEEGRAMQRRIQEIKAREKAEKIIMIKEESKRIEEERKYRVEVSMEQAEKRIKETRLI